MKKVTEYMKSKNLEQVDCPKCKELMKKSAWDSKRYYCVSCEVSRYPSEEE